MHHGEDCRVLSRGHNNPIYIVKRIYLAPWREHDIGVEGQERIWRTNEEVHLFTYSLCLFKNVLMKSQKNTEMKTNQAHQQGHGSRGPGSAVWELTIKGEAGKLPEEGGI